jgi:coenzyme PQQ precursor peptide PqqA
VENKSVQEFATYLNSVQSKLAAGNGIWTIILLLLLLVLLIFGKLSIKLTNVRWRKAHRPLLGGEHMTWTAPAFEEVCLNCEINSYASATL